MNFDLILSIVGLIALVVIAFVIARFLLRLTARAVGCVVTAVIAVGIVAILLIFVF
jgi:hypothetical protein